MQTEAQTTPQTPATATPTPAAKVDKSVKAAKAVKPVKAAKPAAKKAPKAVVKPAAKKAGLSTGKPASAPAANAGTAAAPKPAAPKADKPVKDQPKAVPKEKLVRDSFTMPQADFALIAQLKARALGFQRPTKKSELLRAGLQALAALNDDVLQAVLAQLAEIKTGRPRKGH